MVKQDYSGTTRWLEVGWAETGWAYRDRQVLYVFDTVHSAWHFYDQYPLSDGSRFYVTIGDDGGCSTWCYWSAYVWWNNQWNLLDRHLLPIGQTAFVEEYVEIHSADGTHYSLPQIAVDGVQVHENGTTWRHWTNPPIGTANSGTVAPYCLHWTSQFYSFHVWRGC